MWKGVEAAELFLQTSVLMGTHILFATLGGILSEKAGNMNLGIEGMMILGASFGFLTGCLTGNPVLAVLAAGSAGAAGAAIYAVLTITFRANQVVTGLVLTIFGTGVSRYMGKTLFALSPPETLSGAFAPVKIPVLSALPLIGRVFFDTSLFVPASILLAALLYIYFYYTRFGLALRAVGENPAAADIEGINVRLYKYIHVLAGGFLCGLGGGFLSLVFIPVWQENITSGAGWIAVALVIFSTWNPLRAIYGAYLFGILRAAAFKFQGVRLDLFGERFTFYPQILDMIPYLATIIVLIITTARRKEEYKAPAALGVPYFREER